MTKYCDNGHRLEDTWPDCPYCRRTGIQRIGIDDTMGKTRIEIPAVGPGATVPARGDMHKTVLLSTLRKPPVLGWLVAMSGNHKGEDFRLREGQTLIGSSAAAEVKLSDPGISASHASIRYRDGMFSITDLDSTNGTFVNEGTKPIAREELKDGDTLRFGDVAFKFKCL